MKRRSRCEWMPMLPWPIWPLAGHARLGQNVVVGSMTILLSWLCWGASQEEGCLDPCFLCNLTPPRFSVELPRCLAGPILIYCDCVCSLTREIIQRAKPDGIDPVVTALWPTCGGRFVSASYCVIQKTIYVV